MSTETHAVTPDLLLTDAMATIQEKLISGVPVVDSSDGKLCGIMTTSDILRVFRVVMQLGLLAETPEGG